MSNLQADSAIESGKPLKEVVPMFPSKVAAYQYFANSMSKRFSFADTYCAKCGMPCKTPPLTFTWRANLHTTKTVLVSFLFTALAIFAHHLYSRWVVVEFATQHRLCPACQRDHRKRVFMVAILQKALFAVLILILFLTVPAVIFTFMAMFAAPEGTWLFLASSVIGLALLALVVWGFEGCRRFLIPHSLRQVGRFPFVLYRISETSKQEFGGKPSAH